MLAQSDPYLSHIPKTMLQAELSKRKFTQAIAFRSLPNKNAFTLRTQIVNYHYNAFIPN